MKVKVGRKLVQSMPASVRSTGECGVQFKEMAEREGFEPSVGDKPTHA